MSRKLFNMGVFVVRKVILSLAVMAAGLGAATPAFASKIIYTVIGNFKGDYYPSPTSGAHVDFDAPGTIVANADTATDYFTFFFLSGTALSNPTFTSTAGTSSTNAYALIGLPFTGQFALLGGEVASLGFQSDALQGYDLRTAIGVTPVTWDGNLGEFRYNGGFLDYTSASDLTFSATLAGAVPEPATWAMMILGFALVGGAMRRRAAIRTALA